MEKKKLDWLILYAAAMLGGSICSTIVTTMLANYGTIALASHSVINSGLNWLTMFQSAALMVLIALDKPARLTQMVAVLSELLVILILLVFGGLFVRAAGAMDEIYYQGRIFLRMIRLGMFLGSALAIGGSLYLRGRSIWIHLAVAVGAEFFCVIIAAMTVGLNGGPSLAVLFGSLSQPIILFATVSRLDSEPISINDFLAFFGKSVETGKLTGHGEANKEPFSALEAYKKMRRNGGK